MRTSFVESMGPWSAEESDVNVQGGGGPKNDSREVPVTAPAPKPAPAPKK